MSPVGESAHGFSTLPCHPSKLLARLCWWLQYPSSGCLQMLLAVALCSSGRVLAPIAQLSGCSTPSDGSSGQLAGAFLQQSCQSCLESTGSLPYNCSLVVCELQ